MLRTARKTASARQRKKPRGRPFKPGQSGNPGGRPKGLTEFRLEVREHTPEALKTLVRIMRSKSAAATARVRAASELLDRAWGKPVQELQVQGAMATIGVDERDTRDLSRDDWMKLGQRIAFVLSSTAHLATREKNPTPRPVRRKIMPDELGGR